MAFPASDSQYLEVILLRGRFYDRKCIRHFCRCAHILRNDETRNNPKFSFYIKTDLHVQWGLSRTPWTFSPHIISEYSMFIDTGWRTDERVDTSHAGRSVT